MFGFKIITQYEKGIVFRFGRALPGIREAGPTWVNPFTCRRRKVNMQIVVAAVPGQEAITRNTRPHAGKPAGRRRRDRAAQRRPENTSRRLTDATPGSRRSPAATPQPTGTPRMISPARDDMQQRLDQDP